MKVFEGNPRFPDSFRPINLLHAYIAECASGFVVLLILSTSMARQRGLNKRAKANIHEGLSVGRPRKVTCFLAFRNCFPRSERAFRHLS